MRKTYMTAIAIAVVLGAWLASGQLGNEGRGQFPTLAEFNSQQAALQLEREPTRVRARVINASPRFQSVLVRGRTESKRTVQVRAEISGSVVERPVERGTPVEVGDLLCRISMEDRRAGVVEARAALNQARIEYEGSLELKARGFQSETAIAKAKARLAAAQADLQRNELNMARTRVTAPFAGVVEDVHQEIGDYVTPGGACATIVDLDPMLLVGRISEREVLTVAVGQSARGILSDGRQVEGVISFVGQQSDPTSRTYAVEINVANPGYALRSGITTEIRIPVAEVMAQKISPALFGLDDEGRIGVRIVDETGHVDFHPVDIVEDDVDGVWVTGLPDIAVLITVGQELVVPGEMVKVDFEPASDMPAAVLPAPRSIRPLSAADTST